MMFCFEKRFSVYALGGGVGEGQGAGVCLRPSMCVFSDEPHLPSAQIHFFPLQPGRQIRFIFANIIIIITPLNSLLFAEVRLLLCLCSSIILEQKLA